MILAAALSGLDVVLYLHRVRHPGQGLSIEANTLDGVLSELAALGATQTTVSFDDGYQDAVDYVASRAGRYPGMRFLLNVCPEKIEKRMGFRWDIGVDPESNANIDTENCRQDLASVASVLTTVNALQGLAHMPNVRLGNHSNCHLPLSALAPEQAERELRQSHDTFTRLFGYVANDFAFPFGVPHRHFSMAHVQTLRALGVERIYCTRESPMSRAWQTPGALLPRIHLRGEWSVDQMMKWILRKALAYRLRTLRQASAGDIPL